MPGPTRRSRQLVCSLIAAMLVAGCSSRGYNTPPSALGSTRPGGLAPLVQRVAVVGDFRNPVRANVPWNDVGPGVARSLSQALLNDGSYDVWSNQGLAVEVERVLQGPTHEREQRLGRLHERHQDVRYVIIGHVTDFHYTSEVSSEVRRRGWFGGDRKEAIVAIEFRMVDLEARRLVLADHVYGTAPIRKNETEPVYANLAFGSYLFWNSPLGRATEQAVRRAMGRIDQVVPIEAAEGGEHVIVARPSVRDVIIEPSRGLRRGEQLHVVDADGAAMRDPLTLRPLRVRVLSVATGRAVGFLIGEPPETVDLRGATLQRRAPTGPGDVEPSDRTASADDA